MENSNSRRVIDYEKIVNYKTKSYIIGILRADNLCGGVTEGCFHANRSWNKEEKA